MTLTGGGILTESDDAGHLADGVEAVLSDPAERRRLGLAGRSAVEKQLTVEHMAQQVLDLVGKLNPTANSGR